LLVFFLLIVLLRSFFKIDIFYYPLFPTQFTILSMVWNKLFIPFDNNISLSGELT